MFLDILLKKGGVAPIYSQINEYAYWKSDQQPWIAGARKALLYRLADNLKLHSITELTETHIAYFTGEQLTDFYGEVALKAIRDFLWYCRLAGYNCLSYKMATKEQLKKVGRPVQWDMVRRVKELREQGFSDETIARSLKASLGKRVHKRSVERWRARVSELPE